MRQSGAAKAAAKACLSDGTILIKHGEGYAALLEVNYGSVADDSNFLTFAHTVLDAATESKAPIEELKAQFEETRVALVHTMGEDVNIRRVEYVNGATVASYCHGKRIGVVVAGQGDYETLNCIAKHITATKPSFVNPDDVPAEVIEAERRIQIEIAINEGKPAAIAEKMVVGRMRKFVAEISLTSQDYIMDQKKTVGTILKEKGASVSHFVIFELGEGMRA
eukprot:m.60617 g.60617  ORF g.60617 m.60617 type:complete len:222 (-) comp22861_c0_seq1:412-1077(-)